MDFESVVHNGQVVLDVGESLPEGAAVHVTVTPTPPAADPTQSWMLEFAGKAKGLPADLAAQHDHYLHGTPKR